MCTHATLATVSAEREPWNTPVFIAFDGDGGFYWCSSPEARHSRNLRHGNLVAMAIYNSSQPDATGACIYVSASVKELTEPVAIRQGLEVVYARRSPPALGSEFMGTQPRPVYKAEPLCISTNILTSDQRYPCDERVPISLFPQQR